jgi:hypothetical protein
MTLDYLHIERSIVRLVNEHKKELSLQLLKMDLDLAGVAGRHSTSMIVGDYFGHTDLSGFDIVGRYRLEKITCSSRVSNGSAKTIYRNTGQFWRWQKLRWPAWYSIGSQGRSSSTLSPGASGSAFQLTTEAAVRDCQRVLSFVR